jgi:hypothetical protein
MYNSIRSVVRVVFWSTLAIGGLVLADLIGRTFF